MKWHRRELLAGGLLGAFLLPSMSQSKRDPAREIDVPRYDADYPDIGYSSPAMHNRVWRLREAMASGALELAWHPSCGYLAALLAALRIEADTQTLVFSRTSLQGDLVTPDTPRALYFNDDTYVGYIPGAGHIELTTLDAHKGPVFYTLENVRGEPGKIRRFGGACLTCHDNYSLMGGGAPRILALSLPVEAPAQGPVDLLGIDVDHRTPLADRWGGWYVTGSSGRLVHRGNRQTLEGEAHAALDGEPGADRPSLEDWIDTSRYPVPHSDVVALLVLEHQKTVHNLMARVAWKAPSGMQRLAAARARAAGGEAELATRQQKLLDSMVDPLVDALFMIDAAPIPAGVAAGNGFAARFSGQGPADAAGRSLRRLDLDGKLFRWPLSYLLLGEAFDALPTPVMDAVRTRIGAVLRGADSRRSPLLAVEDRAALREMLAQVKPGFVD